MLTRKLRGSPVVNGPHDPCHHEVALSGRQLRCFLIDNRNVLEVSEQIRIPRVCLTHFPLNCFKITASRSRMPHPELLVLGPVARVRAARVGHRRERSRGSPTRPEVADDHSVSPHVLTEHEHLETVSSTSGCADELSPVAKRAGDVSAFEVHGAT